MKTQKMIFNAAVLSLLLLLPSCQKSKDVGGLAFPPVPNAGNDTTIYAPASSVVLHGTVNNVIFDQIWTKVSGGPAVIDSPYQYDTKVMGLTPGVYVFRLHVWDYDPALMSNGTDAWDEVTVTVLDTTHGNPGNNVFTISNKTFTVSKVTRTAAESIRFEHGSGNDSLSFTFFSASSLPAVGTKQYYSLFSGASQDTQVAIRAYYQSGSNLKPYYTPFNGHNATLKLEVENISGKLYFRLPETDLSSFNTGSTDTLHMTVNVHEL